MALVFLPLLLLLAPLGGCKVSQVSMEIPSFADGGVTGIWLWRYDDTTGQYERDCRVAFAQTDANSKGEYVNYTQQCTNQLDINLSAFIHPAPTDPNTVTLTLLYTRFQGTPSSYKASAYNSAGESGLSSTSLTF
jgi:hypothetical protein